ncbi:MAG: DUF58 domain-containing protein [Thalassotalea sp.]
MAWFNQSKKISAQSSIPEQLADLLTDGVNLSIDELIPYQNKSALVNLTPKQQLHGKMSGNYLARSKGRGMEFDEVRHYQTGDDIRTIDWRVTARTGITHTKLFREEVERPVIIATDLNHTMYFGSQLLFKSVQAAHLAALLAWHAKKRGDRVGGIVFNEQQHIEVKPRSRQEGVLHYLHALCQLHENGNHLTDKDQALIAFEQNCARIRQISKPGSLVYLITDAYQLNENCIRHLALTSQHCELVVCLVSDPLEHQLPTNTKPTTVAVTDGYTKQTLTLGDKRSAREYQASSAQLTQEKKQLLAKAGARILSLSAGSSLEQQIKDGATQWIR